MQEHNILEVSTPILGSYPNTDPNIDSFACRWGDQVRYLQTSPEYCMKRLLARGSGSIYQICKAFRKDEQGALHDPEFTLLEWYQQDVDYKGLLEQTLSLLRELLGELDVTRSSYAELFNTHLGICPHSCSLQAMQNVFHEILSKTEMDHSHMLDCDISIADMQQYLFSIVIEPTFTGLTVITDYPMNQALLAKEATGRNYTYAERFEIFLDQIEIANAYTELNTKQEYITRLVNNYKIRPDEIDLNFLQDLYTGVPPCSGIAIGIDRLFMFKFGIETISQVLPLYWGNS